MLAAAAVHAQSTRLVVPYNAGGATDAYARQLADEMGKRGVQTIVENKPGASGMIAADYVARSKPDGLTLFIGSNSTLVNNVVLFAKMPYDPFKDFVPVSHFGYQPMLLIARSNAPFATVAEYVAYARANPGKINRASVGAGSITNLCAVLLDRAAGITTTHVPYTGEAPLIQAMLSDQLDVYVGSATQAVAHIQSGKFRALAVFDQMRMEQFPGVPTLKESGYDIDALAWFGFVAPAGTPPAVVDRLGRVMSEILTSDSFTAKAARMGWIRRSGTPQEFGRFVQKEYKLWGPLIKDLGLAKSM
ncbi:tripartite tricarboxylate transporter substrate binding protein [Pseudorhodoferax sp. LjRoot39]|uniref:Bug family tripartite tricarboxylate transporter substrate binding protein n=1 Tax=Pseudorhodoferax sp. LjRoot39 TaxID=3342328 RepID=UPI003ECF8AE3